MPKEHAIATIGRFQPPTLGHGHAVSEVKKLADAHNADYFIFGTHSEGDKKNPLPPDLKLKHMRVVLDTPNVFIDPDVRKPPDLLKKLHDMNYKKITLVAGGSRAEEYEKFREYFGKNGELIPSFQGGLLDI